jgi:steroid 5-alpha reductase family enzyme
MFFRSLPIVAIAVAFVAVEMTATWALARRLRNFGIVDAVWSLGFAPIVWLAVILGHAGEGASWARSGLLAAMATFWSLRLGIHLGVRIRAHHPAEDVRYARLRAEWGPAADRKMLGFYLLQGALQIVLALPFVWVGVARVSAGPWAGLGTAEIAGLVLWGVGIAGETVADRQLARFRGDPANRGGICRTGLWNHSRHPNYFFEWVVWVGYAVYASGSPSGWLAWLSPALMYHFLVNVTGVPMTEELSVKSRGDAYRQYQRTTNAFFPGPRKA